MHHFFPESFSLACCLWRFISVNSPLWNTLWNTLAIFYHPAKMRRGGGAIFGGPVLAGASWVGRKVTAPLRRRRSLRRKAKIPIRQRDLLDSNHVEQLLGDGQAQNTAREATTITTSPDGTHAHDGSEATLSSEVEDEPDSTLTTVPLYIANPTRLTMQEREEDAMGERTVSADTRATPKQDTPDTETCALLTAVKEDKSESRVSVGSTAVGSVHHWTNAACYICGDVVGRPRQSGYTEAIAYLDCGHAFGHECLFRWICNPEAFNRCPMGDCISVRHNCEHWTMPHKDKPECLYNNSTVSVLPWNYEFCRTPKGTKLQANIDSIIEKIRIADAEKRQRGKSNLDFTHDALRKVHVKTLHIAEKRLDDNQKSWWTARWMGFTKRQPESRVWGSQRT